LLQRLATASGDILSNTELIENLETTKKTAVEVERKVADAREVAIGIDAAREGTFRLFIAVALNT
jgi:dynein heavy chain